jgi:hypothetical protein
MVAAVGKSEKECKKTLHKLIKRQLTDVKK